VSPCFLLLATRGSLVALHVHLAPYQNLALQRSWWPATIAFRRVIGSLTPLASHPFIVLLIVATSTAVLSQRSHMHWLLNGWWMRFFCSCMHSPPPPPPPNPQPPTPIIRTMCTIAVVAWLAHRSACAFHAPLTRPPALPPPHHRLSVPQVRRRLCHGAEESVGVLRQRKPSLPHSRRHFTVSVSERVSKQRASQRIHDVSSRAGTAWMLLARDGNVKTTRSRYCLITANASDKLHGAYALFPLSGLVDVNSRCDAADTPWHTTLHSWEHTE
jgi:hypothetical protein